MIKVAIRNRALSGNRRNPDKGGALLGYAWMIAKKDDKILFLRGKTAFFYTPMPQKSE